MEWEYVKFLFSSGWCALLRGKEYNIPKEELVDTNQGTSCLSAECTSEEWVSLLPVPIPIQTLFLLRKKLKEELCELITPRITKWIGERTVGAFLVHLQGTKEKQFVLHLDRPEELNKYEKKITQKITQKITVAVRGSLSVEVVYIRYFYMLDVTVGFWGIPLEKYSTYLVKLPWLMDKILFPYTSI